ncbi:hypothetical protein FHG87_001704 [Trinorchestia longiramus]|nr:hypothetical protein FHG87_001704 [Trinorchestia longiramus]
MKESKRNREKEREREREREKEKERKKERECVVTCCDLHPDHAQHLRLSHYHLKTYNLREECKNRGFTCFPSHSYSVIFLDQGKL